MSQELYIASATAPVNIAVIKYSLFYANYLLPLHSYGMQSNGLYTRAHIQILGET